MVTATALGNNFSASSPTINVPLSAAVPAGDLVCIAAYSGAAPSPITITDTQGNTYAEISGVSGNWNLTDTYVFFSVIQNPLSTSDTIAIFPANTLPLQVAATATGFHASWFDNASEFDTGTLAVNKAAAATMTGTATSTLSQSDELVWAVFQVATTSPPTFTPGAGFTTDPNYAGAQGYAPGIGAYMYAEFAEVLSSAAVTATAGQTVTTNTYSVGTVTFRVAPPRLTFIPRRMPLGM